MLQSGIQDVTFRTFRKDVTFRILKKRHFLKTKKRRYFPNFNERRYFPTLRKEVNLTIYEMEQIEVRKCLLSFGAKSIVFQFAIQNFKDQDI